MNSHHIRWKIFRANNLEEARKEIKPGLEKSFHHTALEKCTIPLSETV